MLNPPSVSAMGGKPDVDEGVPMSNAEISDNTPVSSVTPKELAHLFGPDSNATQVQQEEVLKTLLGKKVEWEIVVAQIQREGNCYIIQGKSDKDMIGTFSYVIPTSQAEMDVITHASMGTKLNISGMVDDMRMRHIVLKPACVTLNI